MVINRLRVLILTYLRQTVTKKSHCKLNQKKTKNNKQKKNN